MSLRQTSAPGTVLLGLALGGLLAGIAGCDRPAENPRPRGPASQSDTQGGLFLSVADSLNRVEQFDLNRTLPQISDRLNQWYQQEKPKIAWQPDPAVESLPEELQKLPVMRRLDYVTFGVPDAWYLQESAWLREISKNARADQFDDVAVAERLFDWTVRNIQLLGDEANSSGARVPHQPSEILLFGRGTAAERAWIFTLLGRQQGLDVVLLGLPDGSGGAIRPWVAALVKGDQLHLFDCRLGLPIPGPMGQGVATLEQVAADDALLRRLDLDDEHRYPVTADDLQHVVALVEASPFALSQRMALVESRLTGKYKLALTSPGSRLLEQLKGHEHLEDARLWDLPFAIHLERSKLTDEQVSAGAREMFVFQVVPSLLTGRALFFKGVYEGEQGAKLQLLNARPSKQSIDNYHISGELAKRVRKDSHAEVEAMYSLTMQQGKQDASYWLGLIFFDQKDYPTAVQYFDLMILRDHPEGRWASGAQYNLGRCYEALGKVDEAVAAFQEDKSSPQSHGNQLRARWLQANQKPADDPPAAESPAAPADGSDPPPADTP